jgi:D-alanyl-D-alanine carboxypeptidase/D-alanyl-D-alanine-endopeptidase (penicillin-binding protein 4)
VFAAVALTACTAAATPADPSAPDPSPVTRDSAAPSPAAGASAVAIDVVDTAWTRAIDGVVAGKDVSIAVGIGTTIVYVHAGDRPRRLASNEKLLTTMAALDLMGPRHRFRTVATAARIPANGVLDGDLWLIGGGDPELDATDLRTLAARLRAAGLRRVTGSVLGDRSAFDRGWWAPGWLPGISRRYVTRPTALAWAGNVPNDPEAAAAAALRSALRDAGVAVEGGTGSGTAPPGMTTIASVASAPLAEILLRQNHDSVNLDAEILAKSLGEAERRRGSTAAGAAAIQAWARERGVDASVRDGSGLSNQDRTSAAGVVTLLLEARHRPWFPVLLASLPAPGEGTLSHRLGDVSVRAKTGTLFARPTSALSGYLRTAGGTFVAFSILSEGPSSWGGEAIEDAVVRILAGARLHPG